jgi:hypothetical protein
MDSDEKVFSKNIEREWNTDWSVNLTKGNYTFSVHNITGKISQIKMLTGEGAIYFCQDDGFN